MDGSLLPEGEQVRRGLGNTQRSLNRRFGSVLTNWRDVPSTRQTCWRPPDTMLMMPSLLVAVFAGLVICPHRCVAFRRHSSGFFDAAVAVFDHAQLTAGCRQKTCGPKSVADRTGCPSMSKLRVSLPCDRSHSAALPSRLALSTCFPSSKTARSVIRSRCAAISFRVFRRNIEQSQRTVIVTCQSLDPSIQRSWRARSAQTASAPRAADRAQRKGAARLKSRSPSSLPSVKC